MNGFVLHAMRLWFGAIVLALALPGAAGAAQSLAVTSASGFPAGGHPSYTTTTTLDTAAAGTPSKVIVTLAPGVLASVNANPACVTGTPRYTSACQIGGGSATTSAPLVSVPFTAYLVPPPSSDDVVGIDIVTGLPGSSATHAGAQLVQTASGGVATVLTLDLSSLGSEAQVITQMTLTINGTLGGKPFTRMPTNCSPGSSTLTVVYANRTETSTAAPDFRPTGCAQLPYRPQLSGTATRDVHDGGTSVTTTVTQSADEAASASTVLALPWPTLAPNLTSLSIQNKNIPVGRASSASPLLTKPLQGQVFFTGTSVAPTLTIRFPPPAALTLTGTVDLGRHTVAFNTVPDVPVTNLTVTLFGGTNALLNGFCDTPTGPLSGSFTGQNGTRTTVSRQLTLMNCPGQPVVGGLGIAGLAANKPAIAFTLRRGRAAAKLRSFTVVLPRGLRFVRRGLRRGISVSGSHTLGLSGARTLTVRLGRAADSVRARFAPPALQEAASLRRHPRAPLTLRITMTDAAGKPTSIARSLQ